MQKHEFELEKEIDLQMTLAMTFTGIIPYRAHAGSPSSLHRHDSELFLDRNMYLTLKKYLTLK